MTLILSCATKDYVVQVSDRRLTSLPFGALVDDDANKVVVVGQTISFAYTGLARVGSLSTDEWLAEEYVRVQKDCSPLTLHHACLAVAESASLAFKRIGFDRSTKRHAFVGVGWVRLEPVIEGEGFIPMITTISNALDEHGGWLTSSSDRFGVRARTMNKSSACCFEATGVALPTVFRNRIVRQLRHCVEKDTGPLPIAETLAQYVRAVARKVPTVGSRLMIVCIPRTSIREGRIVLLNGLPCREAATFYYLSDRPNQEIQVSPLLVSSGGVSRFTAKFGELARREAAKLPKAKPWTTAVLTTWAGSGVEGDSRHAAVIDKYRVDWSDITGALSWPGGQPCPYLGVLGAVEADAATLRRMEDDPDLVVFGRDESGTYIACPSDILPRLGDWLGRNGMPPQPSLHWLQKLHGASTDRIVESLIGLLRSDKRGLID